MFQDLCIMSSFYFQFHRSSEETSLNNLAAVQKGDGAYLRERYDHPIAEW